MPVSALVASQGERERMHKIARLQSASKVPVVQKENIHGALVGDQLDPALDLCDS